MELEEQNSDTVPSPPPPSVPPPDLPLILPPPLPARPGRKSTVVPEQFNIESELDNDDEISQQMTASYSEISFKSELSPEYELQSLSLNQTTFDPNPIPIPSADNLRQRPDTLSCDRNITSKALGPLNLDGTVHVEGNMTHFVAEDLEYKIKLSSPVTRKGDTPPLGSNNSRTCTPSSLYRQLLVPQVSQFDTALINDLECEAQRMATSIDNLIENLSGILHSISSITADNVDVYKNAVSKMSDSMDLNIKSMYTMMAKAEEVTQSMKIVEGHAVRIKEIKRLVDLFESFI
ncbi:BLOC-1-related complex subunit 6 [Aethina tumida]|uniref:BLOC-1-related complex subunit 6 n=1 Tax=Aethina tumida TaxID=116153 RepID=UPI00096AF94D|nr:BLOC-1-related complex subunit 6 [Aethina tumida]XP_049826515.1 BLOC-1-related complex subunit 6 [Aethina tumida]